MSKALLFYIMLSLLVFIEARSQTGEFHHPSKDKESWQRLNLQLSSTYLVVAKEGMIGHDSCLYLVSRSLGVSRFPVLGEGMNDPGLAKQSDWIDRQEPHIGMRLLSKATGRRHLQLQILLGAYYVFQPHSYERYKDTVLLFLEKAVAESNSLKEDRLGRIALCLLGKMYVEINDPKGDSIYTKLIDLCKKAGDKETEARALAYRGMYMAPDMNTLGGKIADLQAAAALYHSLGNWEGEIRVQYALGYLYFAVGQLKTANEVLQSALTRANTIHYPYTHYLTEALCSINMSLGKFGEPLLYARQTVNTAEHSRDSVGWAYFYARLALLYDYQTSWDEKLKWTQKSINRFVIDRNPAVFGVVSVVILYLRDQGRIKEALNLVKDIAGKVEPPSNLSDQLFYSRALSSCYLYMDSLDLFEQYIRTEDSLEQMAAAIRGPLRRNNITSDWAILAYKRKQYEKARDLFEACMKDTVTIDANLYNRMNSYGWMLKVDSALGDHKSAVMHYKQYIQLLDSNFRATNIRQAEELQVMYETEEKERRIVLLNQQASQATLVRNLTFGGIAAVLIIAGLLYRQNRLKQKNNELITFKNDQLRHLLTDREWLLKEIHHRVKNNLQIVISLLNSQSVYINNDAALTAIQDSKRRVYAMSLIHQKLYQSENIASIGMPEYINELVNHVRDTLGVKKDVVFEQEIAPVDLDVSQAIPLGLIINECIVNALKYAFPDGRQGKVSIGLSFDEEEHLLLNVSDNGVGLPADFDVMEHNSLGLELIRGLAKQLKGRFNMINHDGFHITIRFAVESKLPSGKTLADV